MAKEWPTILFYNAYTSLIIYSFCFMNSFYSAYSIWHFEYLKFGYGVFIGLSLAWIIVLHTYSGFAPLVKLILVYSGVALHIACSICHIIHIVIVAVKFLEFKLYLEDLRAKRLESRISFLLLLSSSLIMMGQISMTCIGVFLYIPLSKDSLKRKSNPWKMSSWYEGILCIFSSHVPRSTLFSLIKRLHLWFLEIRPTCLQK